jgi:hypothetical protein
VLVIALKFKYVVRVLSQTVIFQINDTACVTDSTSDNTILLASIHDKKQSIASATYVSTWNSHHDIVSCETTVSTLVINKR